MVNRFPVETQTDLNGNNVVAEQQIVGVKDDGSPEGVVRTRAVTSDLVMQPINSKTYTIVTTGTAVADYIQTNVGNGDGTGLALRMQCPAGVSAVLANGLTATFNVHGKVVGIRYQSLLGFVPFGVIIDAQPYYVSAQNVVISKNNIVLSSNNNSTTIYEKNRGLLLVSDLADTVHTVTIVLYPDPNFASRLLIEGTLVERRLGYSEPKRVDWPYGGGTLTASQVAIPVTFVEPLVSRVVEVDVIKAVFYSNTGSVPRTVTVKFGAFIVWQAIIPAGGSAQFVPSTNGIAVGLTHAADAITDVTFVCLTSL